MPPTELPQVLPANVLAVGGPFILWMFFWLAFAVTAWFVFALFYHWLKFGNIYPLSLIAIPVYSVGVLLFVGAMLTGIASL